MNKTWISLSILITLSLSGVLLAEGYKDLFKQYEAKADNLPFSAERGKELFEKKVNGKSCTDCHNTDITKPGEVSFLFLTKSIDPMALSANPEAFSDIEEAEENFDKNCKKVFKRLCTAQEKGDLLTYFTTN